MSLKSRLFRSQWEHKDATVRAQAVAESDDPNLPPELPKIALEDEAASVRLAALKRLNQESLWLKVFADDPDPDIRGHAASAITRLVTRDPGGQYLQQRLAWLDKTGDAATLQRVARQARDLELRRAAIDRISSQGFLGDCFASEPDEDLAREILTRITQTSTLERIVEQLRASDKSRRRAASDRLAELKAASGDPMTRQQHAEKLCQQIEALARGEQIGQRTERLAEIRSAWDGLPSRPQPLVRRFEGAERIVRSALESRPDPAPEGVPAEDPQPAASAQPELERLTEAIRTLATSPPSNKLPARLKRLVSEWDRTWNQQSEPAEPDLRIKDEFMALAAELRARSGEKPAQPEPENADPAELETLMDAVDAALESGDIAATHEALRKARSFLDRLPRKLQPGDVGGRLQRMAGKLKEMRDWQHWSNNKLRDRLIERAEEIASGDLHPDAVTERLKEIRSRWQELDRQEVLPGDRRRFAAPPAQWRKFQAACKQAFESAKPYFEKRHAVQEQSKAELEAFLTQADTLVGDEASEVDPLTRHLRAARQAIRNLDTLPPKSRGPMAGRLRTLMDRLSARLDQAHEAVELEKRRLIAEARKLTHEKDRKAAIDRAKALQAEWKEAGSTRRKRENELWKEFREPIDPLFEELKTERKDKKQADEALRAELEGMCRKAEGIASLPDDELEQAAGPMAGLTDEWQSRRGAIPALRKRFERAGEKFQDRLKALYTKRAEAELNRLEQLAAGLQKAWEARLEGKPAQAQGDQPGEDPLAITLHARLERFADPDVETDSLREEVDQWTDAARQVAIEMEFLAGLESPPEDKRRRMDYQIQRLSNRLAEGAPRPDLLSERARLAQRRLESFPRDPEQHPLLERRFADADKIIKNMIIT